MLSELKKSNNMDRKDNRYPHRIATIIEDSHSSKRAIPNRQTMAAPSAASIVTNENSALDEAKEELRKLLKVKRDVLRIASLGVIVAFVWPIVVVEIGLGPEFALTFGAILFAGVQSLTYYRASRVKPVNPLLVE